MITKNGIDLNVCAYCNTSLDSLSRTVDHLYPKSRGGILSNDNKVPACGKCNKLKANMDVKEFRVAVESMLFLEQTEHKHKASYLKKIRANTEKLINKANDRETKRSLRPPSARSGQSKFAKKKRP